MAFRPFRMIDSLTEVADKLESKTIFSGIIDLSNTIYNKTKRLQKNQDSIFLLPNIAISEAPKLLTTSATSSKEFFDSFIPFLSNQKLKLNQVFNLSSSSKLTSNKQSNINLQPALGVTQTFKAKQSLNDIFSDILIVGDSLSDTGNILNVTEFLQPIDQFFGLNIPVAPPPPYYEGRFSNGPVWVDYLSQSLGKSLTISSALSIFHPLAPINSPITINQSGLSVSPYFKGRLANQSVNFAFGGANSNLTGLGGGEFDALIPGALRQVGWLESNLKRSRQSIDSDALVIYWVGPNDYWTNPNADPVQTVRNIKSGLKRLLGLGARNLLVPNMPILGDVPRFNGSEGEPPYPRQDIISFSMKHNRRLSKMLDRLAPGEDSDLNIIQLDVNSLFQRALKDPLGSDGDFDFVNVSDSYLTDLQTNQLDNANPNTYLFWDDIHPSSRAHHEIAQFALNTLEDEFLIQSNPFANSNPMQAVMA